MSVSIAEFRPTATRPTMRPTMRADPGVPCHAILPLALEPFLLDAPGADAAPVARLAALVGGTMAVLAMLLAAAA